MVRCTIISFKAIVETEITLFSQREITIKEFGIKEF